MRSSHRPSKRGSPSDAIFFHSQARQSQPAFQIKGNNPLTEHYSALSPEVLDGPDRRVLAATNADFLQALLGFDVIIIAGQAKSHCVACPDSDSPRAPPAGSPLWWDRSCRKSLSSRRLYLRGSGARSCRLHGRGRGSVAGCQVRGRRDASGPFHRSHRKLASHAAMSGVRPRTVSTESSGLL